MSPLISTTRLAWSAGCPNPRRADEMAVHAPARLIDAVSGLALALDIFFEEKVLAIEDDVAELRNPIAQDQQAGAAAQHQVQLDMAVSEDEIVDVRVRLQVIFGKNH